MHIQRIKFADLDGVFAYVAIPAHISAMNRREFIQYCGAISGNVLLTSAIAKAITIESAYGEEIPLFKLRNLLNPDAALILVPTDADFGKYQISFNKRTMLTPTARVMCRTPQAVSAVVQWASENSVPLAMRSGGHSFEGLSQSTGIVIDTRLMTDVDLSGDGKTVTTGAGMKLGALYDKLWTRKVTIPAGSCPFVGVTGHTLGGGYGPIARPFGLACDSLVEAEIVTADGKIRSVTESGDSDLYWALRGGGAGSFGLVTKLKFKTHKVGRVVKFSTAFQLKSEDAVRLMRTWQQTAPEAPREIHSIMRVGKLKSGLIEVRIFGQSIGSESALKSEMKQLTNVAKPLKQSFVPMDFIEAVHKFYGGDTESDSIYMKGKSDIVKGVMSDEALSHFLAQLPVGAPIAIFDGYGGAIRDLRDSDTAFAHRENTISTIQYYCQWEDNGSTPAKLAMMRRFHDSLRPIMSGSAYFNYCDLDLKNYAEAYWGKNLTRLIQVKNIYDSKNIFRHAQSIPLVIS